MWYIPWHNTPTSSTLSALQWCHNELDGVSNHQPQDCLLNRLFTRRSKKTSKLRVTGLCVGNSPGTGEFPTQMASNAENVSIWWHHHEIISLGIGNSHNKVKTVMKSTYFCQGVPIWVQWHFYIEWPLISLKPCSFNIETLNNNNTILNMFHVTLKSKLISPWMVADGLVPIWCQDIYKHHNLGMYERRIQDINKHYIDLVYHIQSGVCTEMVKRTVNGPAHIYSKPS